MAKSLIGLRRAMLKRQAEIGKFITNWQILFDGKNYIAFYVTDVETFKDVGESE